MSSVNLLAFKVVEKNDRNYVANTEIAKWFYGFVLWTIQCPKNVLGRTCTSRTWMRGLSFFTALLLCVGSKVYASF